MSIMIFFGGGGELKDIKILDVIRILQTGKQMLKRILVLFFILFIFLIKKYKNKKKNRKIFIRIN